MAGLAMQEYIDMIPAVKHSPQRFLWSSYDKEADVLYIKGLPGFVYRFF